MEREDDWSEPQPAAGGDGGCIDRLARATPLLVLAYFALNALLRSLTPGGLGLDEAELVLHAQRPELAYGPQPPLYGWLQAAAFAVLGVGKPALAVVKAAVLATAFLALWATARRSGADVRLALAAVLAMALIPGITWEGQRALAHTPLALALAAAALAAFVEARARGGWVRHLLLGGVLGVAGLAYWSAAFVGAGIAATLVVRRRAPWPQVAATFALAAVIVAPTLGWYGAHPDAFTAAAQRVDVAATGPWGTLAALAEAVGATLGLPLAVLALALARRPKAPGARGLRAAARADLSLVLLVAAGAFAVLAVAAGLSEVKERYLTPVLFAMPLLLIALVPRRLTAARAGWLGAGVGALLLAVTAGLQWNWRVGAGEPPPQAAPFAALATPITTDAPTVFTTSEWIGGNLRLLMPDRIVLTPENAAMRLQVAAPVAFVWPPSRGDTPPQALVALFEARFDRPPRLAPVERLVAPFSPPHADAPPFALHRTLAR